MHLARLATLVLTGAMSSPSAAGAQANDRTLIGSWEPQTYALRDGPTHTVSGRIFFTDTEWQVLFFVHDENGVPRRGSGEGGRYTLHGRDLVFVHLFNFSAGDALPGLPEGAVRMVSRNDTNAPTEPSRIDLAGDSLTIHFPSGNAMTFRRRSGR